MSNEFLLEVFYIKIRIKNTIKNHSEKSEILIETFAIKNKNKINYYNEDTTYKLIFFDNKILLTRETKEFINKFIFELDNITKSEYYIKEFNTNFDILIKTTRINKNSKRIEIDYEIIDNNNKYSYILDMEWSYEYKKRITRNNKREFNKK